uniref:Uncharacterized protein n=1 Tax=Cacopsylla melanoneura TaxID=428564 RepID=A0A8D8SG58_9HEMI
MTGAASEVPTLWDMDSADYYECDCPGPPPPEFRLPPPPRPPPEFLNAVIGAAAGSDCSESNTLADDLEYCDINKPDPEPSLSPSLSSLAIVGLFSLLLLTFILVATALLCKHKKKMQNLLPCKSSPQNRCDVTHGNGVIYEDLTNIRPRPLPQPSIEMLDVKNYPHAQLPHHPDHHYVTNHYPPVMGGHQPVFICSRPSPSPMYCSHPPGGQDLYNPVYEELSNGSADRCDSDSDDENRLRGVSSEEDFAEDELSGAEHGPVALLSSTGAPDHLNHPDNASDQDCTDRSKFLAGPNRHGMPHHKNCSRGDRNGSRLRHPHHRGMSGARTSGRSNRSTTPASSLGIGPASLDRRRPPHHIPPSNDRTWRGPKPPESYHEGLLVDALLHMYPNMMPNSQRPYVVPMPPNQSCAPYQSVPVIPHQREGRSIPLQEISNGVSSFRPMLNIPPPPPVTSQHKVPSQDSDSGYSNNTSGGTTQSTNRGTSGSSRSRNNPRLNNNSDNLYS